MFAPNLLSEHEVPVFRAVGERTYNHVPSALLVFHVWMGQGKHRRRQGNSLCLGLVHQPLMLNLVMIWKSVHHLNLIITSLLYSFSNSLVSNRVFSEK